MDIKNLSKTMQSLEELNSVLKEFEITLKNKKNAIVQQRQSYKNNMSQKNEQIESLSKNIVQTLSKVTSVAQKIDMVLKEDGSSYNNN